MTNEKDENGNFLPDEQRMTRFGKFLRSTSLDELPEIWNIFIGQMSIIGPRPQLVKDIVFMNDKVKKRHNVRGGLTGLAQVSGRNNLSWEERFEFDLKYVNKISFFKDMKIFFKTILKVFKRSDVATEGMQTSEDYGDYLLRIGQITKEYYDEKIDDAKALRGEKIKDVWIINHYSTPPSLAGLNRHYYFKKELEKQGLRVKLITSSKIHNSDVNMMTKGDGFLKEQNVDGVDYTFVKSGEYSRGIISRLKDMLHFARSLKKLPKYLNQKPDVIYVSIPDLFTGYYAEKLAKKLKVPCVLEVRDLWPESIVEYKNMSKHNPAIIALYHLEKLVYKRASKLIFTMPGGKDYVVNRKWQKKVKLEKIYNVNNGVDLEAFEKQKSEFVAENGILDDSESFKVVYTGSLGLTDNAVELVDIAKELKDDNVQLIVYGSGEQEKEIVKRVKDENVSNLISCGRVPKNYIASITSRADALLLYAKKTNIMDYGCSFNKLFDYLASGKPVISSFKANHSIVEEYKAGIEVEEYSVKEFADAIREVKGLSKEDYEKLCEGSKNAAKNFDYPVLAKKIKIILEESLNAVHWLTKTVSGIKNKYRQCNP